MKRAIVVFLAGFATGYLLDGIRQYRHWQRHFTEDE